MARVVRTSDVLGANSKVESEILGGVSQIMKSSDAQVDTAQMSLPVRPGGLGIHLTSDQDSAACDDSIPCCCCFDVPRCECRL